MFQSKNKFLNSYIFTSLFIIVVTFILLFGFIIYYSFPAIVKININFLTDKDWSPVHNEYNILPMLCGTFAVATIALLIAIPLGTFTALFISEIIPKKYHHLFKSLLELLAGIPSIVYGLVAVVFFSQWIKFFFNLETGRVILTGGLVLSIMVLPMFITLVDDSLKQIPRQYHESALGIGLYPYQIFFKVLLPMSSEGIVQAILLSFGRAIGETMAVMLVIGSLDRFTSIFSAGQTFTSKLGREMGESVFGSTHFSSLIFFGLILLCLSFLFTSLAHYFWRGAKRLND